MDVALEKRVQRDGFGVDRLRIAEERRLHVTRVENAEDRERVPARATVERERDPSGVTRTMAHDRAEPGGARRRGADPRREHRGEQHRGPTQHQRRGPGSLRERPTAEQAFGPLADRMGELVTDGAIHIWIDPPPAEVAKEPPPDLSSPVATLVVKGGRVHRQ